MKAWRMIVRREHLFPLVVGPVDGILTALTLAAGHLLTPERPIYMSLAARIAVASALSGGFVFFVAEYARLRGELVHAERHLNLSSKGQLASSQLGSDILFEAFRGTIIAAIGSFAGAMLPLALGAVLSGVAWLTIAVAVIVLGMLGIVVSQVTRSSPVYWGVALMIAGALLSGAGVALHVT